MLTVYLLHLCVNASLHSMVSLEGSIIVVCTGLCIIQPFIWTWARPKHPICAVVYSFQNTSALVFMDTQVWFYLYHRQKYKLRGQIVIGCKTILIPFVCADKLPCKRQDFKFLLCHSM